MVVVVLSPYCFCHCQQHGGVELHRVPVRVLRRVLPCLRRRHAQAGARHRRPIHGFDDAVRDYPGITVRRLARFRREPALPEERVGERDGPAHAHLVHPPARLSERDEGPLLYF